MFATPVATICLLFVSSLLPTGMAQSFGQVGGPAAPALESFAICNRTPERKPVSVSIGYSVGREDSFALGWFEVDFGDCKSWDQDEILMSPRIAYTVFNKDYIGKGGKSDYYCADMKNAFHFHYYPTVFEDLNTGKGVTTAEYDTWEELCQALGPSYERTSFALTEDLRGFISYTVNLD